jgi:hydrogenase maturation protease
MENQTTGKDAIVALGNPFMGDEGVGPALLERLRNHPGLSPPVDLIDTAGSILSALHALKGRRKVVFLDCALMGLAPGEYRRFLPEQVRTEKNLPGLSLHEGDLMGMLETARRMGDSAEEVVIFGIEPAQVEPGPGLSEAVKARMDQYTKEILREFGIA